ncbi:mannan endo-1,4-beta-mannosidase precursor [Vibrio astriarenae]|nr:mannan endo-1,4-beta-mannosidase precursor [Vibrio sp. C7]
MIEKVSYFIVVLAVTCSISSCGGDSTDTVIGTALSAESIDITPSNPNSREEVGQVLALLGEHSTNQRQGTIVGQQAGQGNRIVDDQNVMGFAHNVEALYSATGQWPAFLSLDYEHDRRFTLSELSDANQMLIDHWNQGGLIIIHWNPMNPWDLSQNKYTNDVDLPSLMDQSSEVYPVWKDQIDTVSASLAELRDAGVVVLWSPIQEMNWSSLWWGARTLKGKSDFVPFYRELYRYMTEEKQLDNLLWVYTPVSSRISKRAVDLDYPGDDVVDVIGPSAYNSNLDIKDYATYQKFNKPMGMAGYGGQIGSQAILNGQFDNRLYQQRLTKDYPGMAFWISWHTWYNGDGTYSYLSIVDNQFASELMNHEDVITREELEREW